MYGCFSFCIFPELAWVVNINILLSWLFHVWCIPSGNVAMENPRFMGHVTSYKPPFSWGSSVALFALTVHTLISCTSLFSHLVGGLEHEWINFPFSWECHHPNWLSYFFRGVETTNRYEYMNHILQNHLPLSGIYWLVNRIEFNKSN